MRIKVMFVFSHLNIRVKGHLSHTLPVLSCLKMHFIHSWFKLLLCDESWASSIIISRPDERKCVNENKVSDFEMICPFFLL